MLYRHAVPDFPSILQQTDNADAILYKDARLTYFLFSASALQTTFLCTPTGNEELCQPQHRMVAEQQT